MKQSNLRTLLKHTQWSDADLAARTRIPETTIDAIVHHRKQPTADQADAIQKAFGKAGYYLDVLTQWPGSFNHRNLRSVPEIDPDQHPAPVSPFHYDTDLKQHLSNRISQLPKPAKNLLDLRFVQKQTWQVIAKKLRRSKNKAQKLLSESLAHLQSSPLVQEIITC